MRELNVYGKRTLFSCGIQWVIASGQDSAILPTRQVITVQDLVQLACSQS